MPSQRHPQEISNKYKFITAYQDEFSITTVSRVFNVCRNSYYEWSRHPLSNLEPAKSLPNPNVRTILSN